MYISFFKVERMKYVSKSDTEGKLVLEKASVKEIGDSPFKNAGTGERGDASEKRRQRRYF